MLPNKAIYLDHAATTPTDPQVVEAMLPFFSEVYGNPSSSHSFGRKAGNAVENARGTLAKLLNCSRRELVFTSCGTESDNMALRGAVMAAGGPCHILTAHTEHHAVSVTAEQLESLGSRVRVTWLPVDHEGRVTPDVLDAALRETRDGERAIVSLMYANNEVGTVQPVRELATVARVRGALFHCDSVQAAGQLSLDVQALGVDTLALSAHKFYGPKGVGLLYVRDGIQLAPAQTGGSQESSRRAGTHNVPLIVGMARALELAYADHEARVAEYHRLRDMLIEGVLHIPGAHLTGAPGDGRLPNHASFVFEGIESNMLLMHLDMAGIAGSSGSACNTGNPKPSEVLSAMGYPDDLALGSLRLTVGKQTSEDDIRRVLDVLPKTIAKVRDVRARQSVTAD